MEYIGWLLFGLNVVWVLVTLHYLKKHLYTETTTDTSLVNLWRKEDKTELDRKELLRLRDKQIQYSGEPFLVWIVTVVVWATYFWLYYFLMGGSQPIFLLYTFVAPLIAGGMMASIFKYKNRLYHIARFYAYAWFINFYLFISSYWGLSLFGFDLHIFHLIIAYFIGRMLYAIVRERHGHIS